MSNKTLRIALTLALTCGAAPAWSLGLGQIEIKSKLSQPLQAEIPIIAASPNELEDLSVRLASPDAFARVGLSRPNSLTANLQFSISKNSRGQPVVRITTSNRLDEPYLSFLVEADWGSGSIVREYTALLDPPYIAPAIIKPLEAPVVAQTQPVQPSPEPVVEPELEPESPPKSLADALAEIPATPPAEPAPPVVEEAPPAVPEPVVPPPIASAAEPAPPVEPAPVLPEPAAPEPAAEQTPPEPVAAQAPPPPPPPMPEPAVPEPAAPTAPLDSYQVNQGDTLSQIAGQVQGQTGASTAQIMLAIQRANPEAFIRDNINLLRKGAVLRIPSSEDVASLNAAEARQLVQQQMDTWRSWRQPAVQPAESAVAETANTPTTPAASVSDSVADSAQPRLEIVPPAAEGAAGVQSGASAGGSGEDLRTELTQKEEELAQRDNEIAELKSRLAEQEVLAQEKEKLIELKDSRLSELETALQNQGQPPAQPAAQPVADPAASAPEPIAATMTAPWYSNPLIIGGGALLMIGGILAVVLRRKRPVKAVLGSSRERLSDSMDFNKTLGDMTGSDDKGVADQQQPVESARSIDDSSLPDKKSEYESGWPSAAPANPTPPARNVDDLAKAWAMSAAAPSADATPEPAKASPSIATNPITERLSNVRDQNPKNLDTHLALIRHLYQSGDKAAFEDAVAQMKPQVVDTSGPHWREVVVMGMGLLPGNPMFNEVRWNPLDLPPGGKRKPPVAAAAEQPPAQYSIHSEPEVTRAEDLPRYEDPALAFASRSSESAVPSSKNFDADLEALDSQLRSGAPVAATNPLAQVEEDHSDDPPLEDPPLEDPDNEPSLEETKLELARAYLDIGDIDGAREMLEEIMAEGGPDTKAQARRLLSEIG